ncbi:PspC domain-containing protein [Parendozoicomonas haliclonae]|uniref:DNA-binding transcriptional activator PspC n=1 Tax=Parendozoicomonas haliclonae TaxID=1960125 RepID=A0A1X7AIJ1_9GAMM|nr:PspC domain-containing protein [Parendozoicomonas haliclonae]SMA44069.1 DNA-binding transcriptional activator PspC [Parendozoicomonas haliclonae]
MGALKEALRPDEKERPKSAIMGVCSYIAWKLNVDVLLVRIFTAAGAYMFSMSRFIVVYIAVGVILSMTEGSSKKKKKKKLKKVKVTVETDADTNVSKKVEESTVTEIEEPEVKEVSRHTVKQLSRSMDRLEGRVGKLEGCIASGHLKTARDFSELSKMT